MILVPYQEILTEKLKRQSQIRELQSHASGHCLHIGKISPGCRRCFTNEQGSGIQVGAKCMCDCPYCYYDPMRGEESRKSMDNRLTDFFYQSLDSNWKPTIFSYQSSGETLLYLDELEKISLILDQTASNTGINQYRYLYTNGILANEPVLKRLQDMKIHEIRFHLSASNFSESVYKNMETASKMGFAITVEEPAWPKHRKQLFDMLPRLEAIGGKHLDVVEVQLNKNNQYAVEAEYPGDSARAYKDFYYHLYDEGLVYDIMEEVIKKNYNFSVIDCSSAVERCRHGNEDGHILFDYDDIDNACADWNYYNNDNKTSKNEFDEINFSLKNT